MRIFMENMNVVFRTLWIFTENLCWKMCPQKLLHFMASGLKIDTSFHFNAQIKLIPDGVITPHTRARTHITDTKHTTTTTNTRQQTKKTHKHKLVCHANRLVKIWFTLWLSQTKHTFFIITPHTLNLFVCKQAGEVSKCKQIMFVSYSFKWCTTVNWVEKKNKVEYDWAPSKQTMSAVKQKGK